MNVGVARGFQYGLAIFALTALIGLANALKVFGVLDRNTLLTHLHSGTLGWITIGVFAVAAWVFGARAGGTLARNIGISALVTAAYVLAFWWGNFAARAVTGTFELLVIYAWWWWVLSRARAEGLGRIDIPKLSVLLGLTTLAIGSTLGVLVQIQYATGTVRPETGAIIGGHASAQVGGYLVLVAAGIAEWLLSGAGRRTTAGLVQVGLLFVGGLMLALGVLLDVQPLLMIATLLQVIAIVMIIVRFGRRAIGVNWAAPVAGRHAAATVLFLFVALALQVALVQALGQAEGDIAAVPAGLVTALDHAMFVGVMTNALFASILLLLADRSRIWPWADHVVFWGLNIGVASFVAVLAFVGSSSGAAAFAHPVAFTAPVMGLAALLGIATLWQRLRG